MELKTGQRAKPETLKRLGFKRLSSTQWVKDGVKVQIIGRRVHNIQCQTHFRQPINHFRAKNPKHSAIAREVLKIIRVKGLEI